MCCLVRSLLYIVCCVQLHSLISLNSTNVGRHSRSYLPTGRDPSHLYNEVNSYLDKLSHSQWTRRGGRWNDPRDHQISAHEFRSSLDLFHTICVPPLPTTIEDLKTKTAEDCKKRNQKILQKSVTGP